MKKWFARELRELCLEVASMCLRDGDKRGKIQWAKWAGRIRRWGEGLRTVTVQRGTQTVREWVTK